MLANLLIFISTPFLYSSSEVATSRQKISITTKIHFSTNQTSQCTSLLFHCKVNHMHLLKKELWSQKIFIDLPYTVRLSEVKGMLKYKHQIWNCPLLRFYIAKFTHVVTYSVSSNWEIEKIWYSLIIQNDSRLFAFYEKVNAYNFKRRIFTFNFITK